MFLKDTAADGVREGDAASKVFCSKSTPPEEDKACAVSLEGEDAEDDNDADGSEKEGSKAKRAEDSMDPAMETMLRSDYRLLITASRLLLLSHNAAVSCLARLSVLVLIVSTIGSLDLQVVVAVAQLFYHCAPKEEMGPVVRALMRILRSTK